MSQYNVGSVSVTNGSASVTGTGTAWFGEIDAGDLFIIQDEGVVYYVASVTNNTTLSLTAPYGGTTNSSASYTIARDLIPSSNVPLLGRGALETAAIFNEAVSQLHSGGGGGGGGLNNVSEDLTPQLGGNLDVLLRQIYTSQSNGDIVLAPNGTGAVRVPAGTYENNVTSDDDIPNKKYVDDQVGTGGLTEVSADTTPVLGGNLDTDDFYIWNSNLAGDIDLRPSVGGAVSVTLSSGNYEDNVTADDDLPNKKYVDDLVGEIQSKRNLLVNGDFFVWQKATFQLGDGYASADKWFFINHSTAIRSTDVPTGIGAVYSASITPDALNAVNMWQKIVNGGSFLTGNAVTISFWAKADSSKNIQTNINNASSQTHALTTAWTRYTHTISSVAAGSDTQLNFVNLSANTVRYRIARVRVEQGTVANDPESLQEAEQYEQCYPFVEKSYDEGVNPGTATSEGVENFYLTGLNSAIHTAGGTVRFAKKKADAPPSITCYSPSTGTSGKAYDNTNLADVNITVSNAGSTGFQWSATASAASGTVNISFHWIADAQGS